MGCPACSPASPGCSPPPGWGRPPNTRGFLAPLPPRAAGGRGATPLSGGRISTLGTVFGVLLLVVLDASFIMNNVNANYAQILKAAFIVGALYLRRGAA